MANVRTLGGFSYLPDGWHPYRATLQWLDAGNSDSDYERSPLRSYYDTFQPLTLAELFGLDVASSGHLAEAPSWLIGQFWSLDRRTLKRHAGKTPASDRSPDSEHVGPMSIEYGGRKLKKLSDVRRSLETVGYRPQDFAEGVVEGIFLEDKGDFRFLPTEGQHRLAAIDRFGYEQVLVRRKPSGPTVQRRHLGQWAREWGLGPSGATVADQIFDFYFNATGLELARSWGLT